jgi:prevent-host-death family protein
MNTVNVRELRNHGGEVLDRVTAGESLTVVRSGTAVAELRPIPQAGLNAAELMRRWRNLPPIDPAAFRSDIDSALDSAL